MNILDFYHSHREIAEAAIKNGISLNEADFDYSDLYEADFSNGSLRFAQFIGATLSYANFSNADLLHADFRLSKLHGTNFENCDLRSCRFDDAKLRGANLARTHMNWDSRELVTERLWQAAQKTDKPALYSSIAGFMWINSKWSTYEVLKNPPPSLYRVLDDFPAELGYLKEWAFEEMHTWVLEGECIPSILGGEV